MAEKTSEESDQINEQDSQTETKESDKNGRNPVKILTVGVLVLCLILFFLYVLSDRRTPYTDQARIKGLSMPVVSSVSGNITDIYVGLHSTVEVGDTIFQIDKRPFELAVRTAEARLQNTQQQVGAKTATVESAAGRLGVARAQLDRAQRNYDRVMKVLDDKPGALSLADRDRAETSLTQAVEQVASAEADLDKAEQQLGVSGSDNPQVRSAVVALEQAHLNLAFSTIVAPAKGVIESYNVDIGYYAAPGQSLAMLVTFSDLWIQADLKENNISNMKPGNPVEFVLDVVPGKVFKGKVRSIGHGVSSGSDERGKLPDVKGTSGWLRDPQRFPVIISVENNEAFHYGRLGGQVDVVVFTGEHSLLNMLGRWRLKLNGLLSYIR
ncbi:MAG: transporter [Cyclobacteriaceae bacterium]|nr:MAG: transporter [Cyclobacteriaceae bacterium]